MNILVSKKTKNKQFFALAGLILKKKYQFLKSLWLQVWTLYFHQVPFNYSPKQFLAWFSTTFYMYEWWCLKKKKRYLMSISGSVFFTSQIKKKLLKRKKKWMQHLLKKKNWVFLAFIIFFSFIFLGKIRNFWSLIIKSEINHKLCW